jgi:hypothetical protein
LRYEIPPTHEGGKVRLGLRLPIDMLARRAGDCDSACLLFLSLLAASGLGSGGIVLTHDHAMVALDIPFDEDSEDWVEVRGRRYLLAECTAAPDGRGRIGRVARQLVGNAVEFHPVLEDDDSVAPEPRRWNA